MVNMFASWWNTDYEKRRNLAMNKKKQSRRRAKMSRCGGRVFSKSNLCKTRQKRKHEGKGSRIKDFDADWARSGRVPAGPE